MLTDTSHCEAERETEALGEEGVLMVDLVGIGEFQIDEVDLLVLEERPGVPCATMQFHRNRTRNDETRNVFQRRLSLRIVEVLGRRDSQHPGLAAQRCQT